MNTIILIPPSEGKELGGNNKPLNKVSAETKKLLLLIKNADPHKLYGVKGTALESAVKSNKNVLISNTMPAIERYTGVVYSAINYPTLKNKKLFNNRVKIVSGLFGLVNPQDNIPNYKLKIDKLGAAKLWLENNSNKLQNCFIVDLLPLAHRKAISYDNGIIVDFVLLKNGRKMPAGHQGKYIKGLFIRWLIENDITSAPDFKKFKTDGYSWNGKYFLKEI